MFAPYSKSFTFTRGASRKSTSALISPVATADAAASKEVDDSAKRTFLKVAGGVGLGAVALSLIPNKAEALMIGGNSASNPVGVKNAANTRINPATEDTLALVKADADTIVTNTESIQTNTASIVTNTANIPAKGQAVMAQSMPVTIASDQSAIPISGTMSFDPTSVMTVNPADSLFYLRKIVKQLEPITTTDSANRQRVIIDGSVALTVTLATTAITTVAGQGTQMYQDVARNTYANGVRNNLAFS